METTKWFYNYYKIISNIVEYTETNMYIIIKR